MNDIIVESVDATAVDVPMKRPLVTGGGTVDSAPLVLIRLKAGDIEGASYVFCYTRIALAATRRLIQEVAEPLTGRPVHPQDAYRELRQRFRLLGNQGLVAMACAGIDMAMWDVAAKAAGLPLCRLLGAAPRSLSVYNSNGLGLIGPGAAAAEARELVEPGFRAIKLRLGYATLDEDLAVVNAVHDSVGKGTTLMVDYNQCLSAAEAEQRMRVLDSTGIYWLEEPTLAEDHAGHARIRASSRTPVQLGENCWGPSDMRRAIETGACDYFMPDAVKIGGVSGWLRAAAIGESHGVPLSSHLFPEVSAHLLAATPTAHWLEHVDWAEPVLDAPLSIENGIAVPGDRPGIGIAFRDDAVDRYRVDC